MELSLINFKAICSYKSPEAYVAGTIEEKYKKAENKGEKSRSALLNTCSKSYIKIALRLNLV